MLHRGARSPAPRRRRRRRLRRDARTRRDRGADSATSRSCRGSRSSIAASTLEEMDVDARHRAPAGGRARRRARAHQRARRAQRQALGGRACSCSTRGSTSSPPSTCSTSSRSTTWSSASSASRCARRCPTGSSATADQVVNLDISAEDLRQRLREGKIYRRTRSRPRSRTSSPTRISRRCASSRCARWRARSTARARRSCGARQAATRPAPDASTADARRDVEQSAATARALAQGEPHRRPPQLRLVLRVRADARTNAPTASTATRAANLVDNIQLAQSMGAEVVKLEGADVAATLVRFAAERGVDARHRRGDAALALVPASQWIGRRAADGDAGRARRARRIRIGR